MKIKKMTLNTALCLLSFSNSISSQKILYAGYPIFFATDDNKTKTKSCTAAFIGNRQGNDGFITSAQCCINENCIIGNRFESVYENKDDVNATRIGWAGNMRFSDGLEYVFVSSVLTDWDNILYTAGLTSKDGAVSEIYPATSYLTPNKTGLEVCAYGSKSGYNCGNLTEIDLNITVTNPWNGNPTILNVNKIDLGTNEFLSEEDLGGPVYMKVNNNGSTIAQVLGHIVVTNNGDSNHKFLYYMPIEKVLSSLIFELATRFPARSASKTTNLSANDKQVMGLEIKNNSTIEAESSPVTNSLVEVPPK